MLAAADRLFYAEGIHAVGVDRIVAEADVAKASLYSHFRAKDAILEAYLDGRSGAWREHVEAELPRRGATGRDGVAAVFDLLGEWFAAPGYAGCPFINAAAECGTDGPVGELTGRHREWVRGLFRRLLTEDRAGLDSASTRWWSSCACSTTGRWPGRGWTARPTPPDTPSRPPARSSTVLCRARSAAGSRCRRTPGRTWSRGSGSNRRPTADTTPVQRLLRPRPAPLPLLQAAPGAAEITFTLSSCHVSCHGQHP
ncbi:TetR family transcriptional regulator [Pseudonocardia sp. KRD-184]|uniref:TetR family transcriptional regulator n=1 Tax=Pseudonocardia oceani TaxID=2792013 RepID=A0ABS6UBL1_9PSEU|nr:TetR family transcriptional regulator [Pseudonocardia oceani]MBW0096475.1 TetR family transcriptional regulator [Pseudonocardia oceani]MBW0109435.1 TetR family transcriptional regulator [Pseudonocardia oceani]MBW0123319.1 TetR family transcriptional regulator [Pseudonocardia oceani]MBW0129296.1 TetR family transcriptional regulator [Pseudonocardia oceani]